MIGDVHNHPRFTKGAKISTATTKAPSSGAANPPQQQQKADIVRKLRDLWAAQTRLQKAVDTLVMEYRPTTSGAKCQVAKDYTCQRLNQLTHGINTTFQQDQKLLETVLLTKQRRRDECRQLLNDLRRKSVTSARAKYLESMSKTGAADMRRETVATWPRVVRRTTWTDYFELKSKTDAANMKRKTAAARPRVAIGMANRHNTRPVKLPNSTMGAYEWPIGGMDACVS